VLRGKAMNLIAERVKVTDPAGHEVDVKAALNAPVRPTDDTADDTAEDTVEADAEDADAEDAEDADA